MIFPVVGQTLVEVSVIFFGDFLSLSHPDWLGLVKLLQFSADFFYFLFLLVLLFVFLDFDVVLLFFFVFIIGNFFFSGLFDLKVNGETDEFGVFLDQILQFSFFKEFDVVALDAEDNFGTSAKGWSIIFRD
jgi:hypothetical protein